MIKRRKFPKIFFGWWTVLAGGSIGMWAIGYSLYGFSALFKPISQELGLSRTAASVPVSFTRLEGGFEAPLTGWLTDKFGPKWVVLPGVFVIGLSLILMNFVDSLWAFYVVWGVMLGTGVNVAQTIPVDTAVTNWFVKKRGLALGTRWVLQGLSGTLVLPLIAWLIITQGWRTTCLIGGVVMWLVGLPLAWFCFKRHRPEYYGLLPDGATVGGESVAVSQVIDRGIEYAAEAQEVEFTLKQAMKTPAYWLMIAAGAVHGLVLPVVSIHAVPFLTDMGIEPFKAAAMMSIHVTASLPSRFLGGLIADHVKRNHLRFIMAGCYLLQALGVFLFVLNPSIPMVYVFFILYGLGMGAPIPIYVAMDGRYFGRKAFGSIRGSKMMFMTPISVAAPIYTAWIYDTTGSYMTAFILLAGLLAFASVIISFTLPPKAPARITDVRKIV